MFQTLQAVAEQGGWFALGALSAGIVAWAIGSCPREVRIEHVVPDAVRLDVEVHHHHTPSDKSPPITSTGSPAVEPGPASRRAL